MKTPNSSKDSPKAKRWHWRRKAVLLVGLAGVSWLALGGAPAKPVSSTAAAKADIDLLVTQIKTYEIIMGAPPSHVEGLQVLVTPPATGTRGGKWRQLMKEVPVDPWDQAYSYRYPATKSTANVYDIFSNGPDREAGSADDIGNW